MSGLYFHDTWLWIYNFSKVEETLGVNFGGFRCQVFSSARDLCTGGSWVKLTKGGKEEGDIKLHIFWSHFERASVFFFISILSSPEKLLTVPAFAFGLTYVQYLITLIGIIYISVFFLHSPIRFPLPTQFHLLTTRLTISMNIVFWQKLDLSKGAGLGLGANSNWISVVWSTDRGCRLFTSIYLSLFSAVFKRSANMSKTWRNLGLKLVLFWLPPFIPFVLYAHVG